MTTTGMGGRSQAPRLAGDRRVSFCRICEAFCGIVVTVNDDEKVVKIEGDADHPVSRGFICPKGVAMTEVQNDPERVLRPLKRVGVTDRFEEIDWEQALDEIAAKTNGLVSQHGSGCLGNYVGNPAAFAYAHMFALKGFFDAIGPTKHFYNTNSQDAGARLVSAALLYDNALLFPIPDLKRTTFMLIVGANPIVTMGSAFTAPRVRELLTGIVARHGRVVVVDPRRTPTARLFEHIPIRADTDAWFLLSMLQVIFEEGLANRPFLDRHASNVEVLERLVADFTPESTEGRTGVPAAVARALARDFANADGAVAYGRLGIATVTYGTLVSVLVDSLNAVTGNLDRAGGTAFGFPAVDFAKIGKKAGMATYNTFRSRIGDLPEVMGTIPTTIMAREITTPGPGQLRGLFVSAGNPVLSAPNGQEIARALDRLELAVALDFYMSETAAHCQYVLPCKTFLEREDIPLFGGQMVTPFAQATPPVVAAVGEAREEWEIFEELARRMGLGAASSSKFVRWLGRRGISMHPRKTWDVLIRTGPAGDRFGLRKGGVSFSRLLKNPHGVVLRDDLPTGVLSEKLSHAGGRVNLGHPLVAAEVDRLRRHCDDPEYPLKLIGRRDLRTINSWMHNAPRLVRSLHPSLLVNPKDAADVGVETGERVRVRSRAGWIDVAAEVTDDMVEGTVSYPHGWGHQGGWTTANSTPGVCSNTLASDALADVEPVAGMSRLNGIPVRLEPCP